MWNRLTALFVPKKAPTDEVPEERVIHISGSIDDRCANEVIARLLFHQMRSKRAPIVLEIDSPGGNLSATFAILDTIRFVQCPVQTECVGHAYGCAALILAAGERGHRRAAQEAELGFCQTVITDDAQEKLRAQSYFHQLNEKMVEELANACRQPKEQIVEDLACERSFTFEEAVRYGLIDGEQGRR